jgi:WD40 repeat protein
MHIIHTITEHTDYVRVLVFSPGQYLCVPCFWTSFFSFASFRRLGTPLDFLFLSVAWTYLCTFNPCSLPSDERTFISGGKDGTMRIFEVDSGQQILHVRCRAWWCCFAQCAGGPALLGQLYLPQRGAAADCRWLAAPCLRLGVDMACVLSSVRPGVTKTITIFNIENPSISQSIMGLSVIIKLPECLPNAAYAQKEPILAISFDPKYVSHPY